MVVSGQTGSKELMDCCRSGTNFIELHVLKHRIFSEHIISWLDKGSTMWEFLYAQNVAANIHWLQIKDCIHHLQIPQICLSHISEVTNLKISEVNTKAVVNRLK